MLPVEKVLPEGFKMTELGPLPTEWEVARLHSLGRISSGGSAPQGNQYYLGTNPFVRVQHLDEDGYEVRRWDLITEDAVRKYRLSLFPPGTIVFPKSGASIRLEKRAVLARPSYLVSHLCAIVPNNDAVDGDFLFFALRSISLARAKAEGYPTLSLAEIRQRCVPLPPRYEQRAIAHVLRTVQRAKEATERVIGALKELKKSLMCHLFTYGPVPVDQADQVPLKETEVGPVPEGWEMVRLGEVVERGILLMRNGFPEGRHNVTGMGVPHLRPFNITNDGALDLSQIKFVAPPSDDDPHWLHPGDVIFNNTNSEELVGKTALFNCDGRFVLSNHMTFLRILEPNQIDSYWLARLLHLFWYLGMYRADCRRDVNQASISLERLKGIRMPLPPLPEQRAIAETLRTVDRKMEAEQLRKRALEALFKTLLHHLMTGKVRVKGFHLPELERTP
jgi:type I restriction enzyme S subunit